MEIFAERLKELRIEKGYSQEDIAKAIGVTRTAISYWETNKKEPVFSSAVKLSKYFNVSLEYLAGLED